MNTEELAQQIQALNTRVTALYTKSADSPPQQPTLLSEALAEIQTGLDQLTLTQQELRARNDELLAEREILEAERRRCRDLLESLPEAYLVTDAGGTIREANRAATALLHTSLDSILGKPLADFVLEQEREAFLAELARLVEGQLERSRNRELHLAPLDQSPFGAELGVSAIRDAAGKATGLQWLLRDIAERKPAEEALAQERNVLRTLIDSLPDYIYVKDTAGRFVIGNTAIARVMGATAPDDLTGKTDHDFYPQELAAQYHAGEQEVIRSGQSVIGREEPIIDPAGNPGWVSTTQVPLRDPNGTVVGLVGIGRDITERKRAEEGLRDSEKRFRALVENSSDTIAMISGDGTLHYVGPGRYCILGRDEEEYFSRGIWEFVHPEDREKVAAQLTQLAQLPGKVRMIEARMRHQDGSWRWVEAVLNNLLEEPSIQAIVVNYRDVTERKKGEEALRASEERFRMAMEATNDGLWEWDVTTGQTYYSPAYFRMLGYEPEEFADTYRTWVDLIHPDDREHAVAVDQDCIENRLDTFQVEFRMRAKNGEWRWILGRGKAAKRDAGGRALLLVGTHVDITERKRAEGQIQRRADEFAGLYETARDLTTVQDLSALLQTIVQRAVSLVDAASGSIDLYDPARQEVEIAAVQGVGLSIGARFRMGEGIAGRAAQNREPIIVDDYQTWEHRSPTYTQIPFRAILELPMLHHGELIGILAVHELGDSTRKFSEADARLLSLFAAQAAAAVSNARLLVETSARAQQLALLYDAGLALNSVLEPRAQLEFLFNIAVKALRADRVEFFSYDAGRDEARFELGIGFDEASREALRNTVFSGGCGVVGWVTKNRLPVTVPDVLDDSRWVPVETQVRSALFVPVEHESELLGVLGVLGKRTNAFTPQDERLLSLFGNQAAVALENARLFEERQRRLEELEAVNKISSALRLSQSLDEMLPELLDEILTVLGTSAGQISLYDAESDILRVAVARGWFAQAPIVSKADEGIRVHVMRTGQSYVLHEFKSDPNTSAMSRSQIPAGWSGALVPLSVGRDVIGVLAISVPLPREIQPRELQLLNTLAEIAGNAIHRARLHRRTEHQMQHLAALHTIDMAISASLDLKFSLDIILEQIMAELRIDAVDVLLLKPLSQTLEHAAGRGFRTESLQHTRLRLGEGLAGRAALERRTINIPDLAQDPDGLLRSKKLANEQFVAYYAAPLIAKGQIKGVLEIFHRAPLNPDLEWLDFLEALSTQLAIAVDSAELFVELQRSNVELALAYDTTLEGWGRALDLRDKETEGHTERVAKLTVQLARRIGVSEAELVNARRGALLHDIGKMGIPDHILLKPGPLTPEEWEIMRRHPVYAFELLLPIPFLRAALDIPYCHHEKWDGSGYPRGLKGDQIPLAARIFAVVDVWDALRSDRPYRGAWRDEQVYKYILEQVGTHFDPKVAQVFLQLMDAESEGAGPLLPQRTLPGPE